MLVMENTKGEIMEDTEKTELERAFLALDQSIFGSDCFSALDAIRYSWTVDQLIKRYRYTEEDFYSLQTRGGK